ncbi:unnamed protein product, partial [marine sediment metagenome]
MLMSMTGFSVKNVIIKRSSGGPLDATLVLKSLNARYFEVLCKLPFALTHLETEIIKFLKVKLIRGTVFVNVQINNPSALKSSLKPSKDVVANYVNIINDIKSEFDLPG